MDGRPAMWYREVFDLAFHNLDRERAAALWRKQLEKPKKKKKDEDDD